MFIITQIPFVDFRLISDTNYIGDDDSGCFFPNIFPDDLVRSKYYRFLGVRKSRYAPNELPISERNFFNSQKVIQLEPNSFKGDALYIPKLLFSRFFADVHSFHFDVGIRESLKNNILRQDLNKFAKHFLVSPLFGINRKFEPEEKYYDLIGLADEIKQIYLYATTSKKKGVKDDYAAQITLGHPAMFIVYDKSEAHTFGNAREVKLQKGIKVHYDLVSVKNTLVDVWYIGKDELSKYDQDLRNLRIYLSKLHSYKESTRIILDYFEVNGNKNIDLHKAGMFLAYMLKQISRDTYYGYDNDDFWSVVFYVSNKYDRASWDEFKFRIEAKLKEIEMSTNKNYYSQQNINGGDFRGTTIIGQNINEAGQDDDYKKYIQEFEQMAQALIKENDQLTEQQQNFLKSQTEMFKDHVNSEKAEPSTAKKLLDNIKVAFQFAVINSEGIQRLMEIGKKIIEAIMK